MNGWLSGDRNVLRLMSPGLSMASATRNKLSRQKNYPGDSLACSASIAHADLGQEGFVVILLCLRCTGGIQLEIKGGEGLTSTSLGGFHQSEFRPINISNNNLIVLFLLGLPFSSLPLKAFQHMTGFSSSILSCKAPSPCYFIKPMNAER